MEGTFEDPGFGLLRYLSLIRFPLLYIRKGSGYLLCYGSYLGYFAWIQEGICSTAEGSTNIEGDHEFPRVASVDGGCHIHIDLSEGKAMEEVRKYSVFSCQTLSTLAAQSRLPRKGTESCHTESGLLQSNYAKTDPITNEGNMQGP